MKFTVQKDCLTIWSIYRDGELFAKLNKVKFGYDLSFKDEIMSGKNRIVWMEAYFFPGFMEAKQFAIKHN